MKQYEKEKRKNSEVKEKHNEKMKQYEKDIRADPNYKDKENFKQNIKRNDKKNKNKIDLSKKVLFDKDIITTEKTFDFEDT